MDAGMPSNGVLVVDSVLKQVDAVSDRVCHFALLIIRLELTVEIFMINRLS